MLVAMLSQIYESKIHESKVCMTHISLSPIAQCFKVQIHHFYLLGSHSRELHPQLFHQKHVAC